MSKNVINNDLIKLYKEISGKETDADVKYRSERKLQDKMRELFLEPLATGGVLGYEKLHAEIAQAITLLEKIKIS